MKTTGTVTTETTLVTITTTEYTTTEGEVIKRAEIVAHIDKPVIGKRNIPLDTDQFVDWLNEFKVFKYNDYD